MKAFVCMGMKKAQFEKAKMLGKYGFAILWKLLEALLKFLTKHQAKEGSLYWRKFT